MFFSFMEYFVSMRFNQRRLLAFIVAPLVNSFIFLFISVFLGGENKLNEGIWLFLFTALISYAVTFIAGIPAHLILNKYKFTKLIHYIFTGSLISLLPISYFVIYPVFPKMISLHGPHMMQIALFFSVAQVTVISFWLISRPDKLDFRVQKT